MQKCTKKGQPFRPRGPAGLEALWAWIPCGTGGSVNLEALWAWRPFGPGCSSSLQALWAWRTCGPGAENFFLAMNYLKLFEVNIFMT